MSVFSDIVDGIKFVGQAGVCAALKPCEVTVEASMGLLEESFRRSPRRGRMVAKGLFLNQPRVKTASILLQAARRTRNPTIHAEVVRAFKERKQYMPLMTAVACLPKADARRAVRDYAAAKGDRRDIGRWFASMASRHVTTKRGRPARARRKDLLDDVGDFLSEAGHDVTSACTNVWDALSGGARSMETFGQILGDVASLTQKQLDTFIEFAVDKLVAVEDVVDRVAKAIEKGIGKIGGKVLRALGKAGRSIGSVLAIGYARARKSFTKFVKTARDAGYAVWRILGSVINDAKGIYDHVLDALRELRHSAWYILKVVAARSVDLLGRTFKRMVDSGIDLAKLAWWCVRKTTELAASSLDALIAVAVTAGEATVAILKDPRNLKKIAFDALRRAGARVSDFVRAAGAFGKRLAAKAGRLLLGVVGDLTQLIAELVKEAKEDVKTGLVWLKRAGFELLEVTACFVARMKVPFCLLLDVIYEQSWEFLDVLKWIGEREWARGTFAEWLGRIGKGGQALLPWLRTRVVAPLVAAGEVFLLIWVAHYSPDLTILILLAAAALLSAPTDFEEWPTTLPGFRRKMKQKSIELQPPGPARPYVVMSDVHMETRRDVREHRGHFYKNKDLVRRVLAKYAHDEFTAAERKPGEDQAARPALPAQEWTLIGLGDMEDFWLNDSWDDESLIGDVIDQNRAIYDLIAREFHRAKRFIKIRGNHDAVWSEESAVRKLQRAGYRDLRVYDFAHMSWNGDHVLFMHGHQFDRPNCDNNGAIGKFITKAFAAVADTIDVDAVEYPLIPAPAPFYGPDVAKRRIDNIDKATNPANISEWEPDAVKQMARYKCSLVAGHSHSPVLVWDGPTHQKAVRDEVDKVLKGFFYANTGCVGWTEGCIPVLEITADGIYMKAWEIKNGRVSLYKSVPLERQKAACNFASGERR